MDAEDYYESRRLKDEADVDRFAALKAKHVGILEKEIRNQFELGFLGDARARIPVVQTNYLLNTSRIGYRLRVPEAVYDICHHQDVIDALMDAVDPMNLLHAKALELFRETCIVAYIREYADDLAEVAAEEEFDELKKGGAL